MIGDDFLFGTQGGDVAGLFGYPIVEAGLVGMAGIQNHYPLVGQYQKSRVVVIVGLKPRPNEYFFGKTSKMVVLQGFDVAPGVDVADPGAFKVAFAALMIKGSGVGKPTPGTAFAEGVAFSRDLVLLTKNGTA